MKLFLVTYFFIMSSSHATLGEHESQITVNEAKNFKIKNKTMTQSANYSIHELAVDGCIVKEFANSSGVIFAASWSGIKTPDLSVIFGTYFNEYKIEREKVVPVKGKRFVSLKSNSLVVSSGGHSRNLHGFAYIPTLVPPGLDISTLY